MKRVRINRFIPDWESQDWKGGVFKRYAHKFIQKNAWKYTNLGLGPEDLMQEAWICFDFCVKKYTVQTPQHFMVLYMKRIHDQFWLLSRRSAKENLRIKDEEESAKVLSNEGKHDYNHGYLRILLEQAPDEIKEVLKALISAPSELLDEFFLKKRIVSSDIRKILGYPQQKALCKALGYKNAKVQDVNLLDLFKEYFT
jgi:hypothetical protein